LEIFVYSKSSKTREKLLEATSLLLRTKGYNAMGLSDIIGQSGVPKGSLYHHFPDGKEGLAAGAVDFAGQKMLVSLQKLIDKTGSPVAGIQAFCDYYIQQLEESGYRKGCPLATVALETAADVPMVQQACANAFSSYEKLLAEQIHVFGAPEEKANHLAITTISAIEGALLLAKAQNSTAPLQIMRDQLSDLLKPFQSSQKIRT
jgi:TetR/AcrR family transcriptional repressor of lmrAB and yxaGH operons